MMSFVSRCVYFGSIEGPAKRSRISRVFGQLLGPYLIDFPRAEVQLGQSGWTVTLFTIYGSTGKTTDPPGGLTGTFSAFINATNLSRFCLLSKRRNTAAPRSPSGSGKWRKRIPGR